MRDSTRMVFEDADFAIAQTRFGHLDRSWGEPCAPAQFGLIFAQGRAFRCRAQGVETVIDAATACVARPNTEVQFASTGAEERTSQIIVSESMLARLLDADPTVPGGNTFIPPRLALARHLLFARARCTTAEVFELTERSTVLVGEFLTQLASRQMTGRAPSTVAAHQCLANEIRELLVVSSSISLPALAAEIGSSPYHVSRVFRGVTGMTLSRYRIRLRACQALNRIAEGETDLSAVAAELGFTDQAHMTNVLRAETGCTPARLRDLIGPSRR